MADAHPEAAADSQAEALAAAAAAFGLSMVAIVKPTRAARVGMQLGDTDLEPMTTVVEELAEGGLAAESGMCVGDTLITVNDVAVTDHEQGAGLVLASEGAVYIVVRRPPAGEAPSVKAAATDAAATDAAGANATADALGSGATLESLGLDLSAVLPSAVGEGRSIDLATVEEVAVPEKLTDAAGRNAHPIACKYCGCAVLPAGKAELMPDVKLALPAMPRAKGDAAPTGDADTPAKDVGFWRARDKMDFDNVGVTKAAGEAAGGGTVRFLICAACDLGPFGRFTDSKEGDELGTSVDFFVAVRRVRYT